ncbi:bifunctional 2-keto-4-hydroxyglutarate aldolase/2-keto-3-deoxy-6-phosphogluconate aldolase [Thermoactinomyces mirandus]|uniref:Bifunctional 2-keto-4-hydroxyglutarate aldolase/2-keto-3-deoxy-6-phosphogluconate aldolase n=1 Tax=Thermoactinomyces mirandus TaxID=2756294 RepID=A0A7W2AQ75_9BACL|nr:bifunctional 2-keto-4-hydroxyglutarate aldolase/2-keto-3-deoxy-6-phosphogluconate aldolase [Thermoactinomyces mirandus]MBA4600997.1 bifunctional 2-keto-4-hydroxyglutarate aldolase/2-keto-3-deoxy-6-phosphogluconate aldolase [Thermoactinomyces mirandus]
MKKAKILNRLSRTGIIAVVRTKNVDEADKISRACMAGGITSLEITFTLAEAAEVIKSLKQNRDGKELLVGAGTVLDSQTARMAILAGANFIVSPAFDSETSRVCNRYHIPYIPGCMTVTEMVKASEAGCDIIKLFPGSAVSPRFIKDVKAPLPDIEIMPTGGISLENVEQWIVNGALAVGVGGKLTSGTESEIADKARQFSRAVQQAKEKLQKNKEKGARLWQEW